MSKKASRLRRARSFALGLRVQLALCYTIVSATLILFFSVTFYASMQQILASSFDTTLQLRSQHIAEGVTLQQGHLVVDDIVNELPELDATAAIVDTHGDDKLRPSQHTDGSQRLPKAQRRLPPVPNNDNILVRVLDTQGHSVYQTATFNTLSIPKDSITQPLHGKSWRGTILGPQGQPIRLYSTLLLSKRTIVGVVQIGHSLDDLNTTLQYLLLSLLLITPLLLTLSTIGSYWLAGRAFRPIHRLTRTARELGIKDLHQRVPVPQAEDEVQELAIIFNQMIERLERAFIQQRRFVADASHELRTPVAVIRSMAEVALAQAASSVDYTTVLEEIRAESERLGKLTNALLALARADEGQTKLDADLIRLDLLTADVAASLEPLAEERGITLNIHTLSPAVVLGDTARLIQILMGLVDNALIYTNPGGTVTLSVETCTAHTHVIVQDTGIGIAPKDLAHIFERFYRADPARSKAAGGSGLGLAIADWAVRAHGGIITVTSKLGQGSTFLVTLPLAPDEQA